jgi:hypothetical protein
MRFSTLSSTSFGSRPAHSPPQTPRRVTSTPFERLCVHDDFRIAVRDNDTVSLIRMLDGCVFDEEETQGLHRFANQGFAQNSPDAVRLLRSVKAGEAVRTSQALVPCGSAETVRTGVSLTSRQIERVCDAFQRGDLDELKILLEGWPMTTNDVLLLTVLGAKVRPD